MKVGKVWIVKTSVGYLKSISSSVAMFSASREEALRFTTLKAARNSAFLWVGKVYRLKIKVKKWPKL